MRPLTSLVAITSSAMLLVMALAGSDRVASRDHAAVIDGFILHTRVTSTMEVCSNGDFQHERDDLAHQIAEWTYPSFVSRLDGTRDEYRSELITMSDARRDEARQEGCRSLPMGGQLMRVELINFIDQRISGSSPSL